MRVVVVLPDSPYYLWQALVQAAHLEEQGFTDVHHLVHHQRRTPSPMLQKMADGVPSVQPVEVTDAQWAEQYQPALKPLTLSRWMRADPAREDVPFFYLDPDAVFTRPPERMPPVWHGSDTDWYTGPDYIRSKGEGLWEAMCGLAEVDPDMETPLVRRSALSETADLLADGSVEQGPATRPLPEERIAVEGNSVRLA